MNSSISSTAIYGLATTVGARQKLDIPTDAELDCHGDWLAVKPREPWTVGTRTYASDTVLGMSLSRFLAGERDFRILSEAGPRRAVQHFFWAGDRLVISILDELRPVFEVWTPAADGWTPASCLACPRSASPMSGGSTPRKPKATATCSPTSRTR